MQKTTRDLLSAASGGRRPDAVEARALAAEDDLAPLLDCAAALRDRAHPDVVTYSRKVFIPLTISAATFATTAPSPGRRAGARPPS